MADSSDVSGGGGQNRRWSDARVARVAQRQFGVVSLEQLRAVGLSYEEIRRRAECGLLHRLHRGVFAVGHLSLVPHARLVAALLACGLDSFISHRTAAAVWGLRVLATRRIEVTVPHTRRAVRAGLTLHRTSHPPAADDLAIRNGLRVSSVPRLLLELAGRERPSELDRLNPQGVRKRVLVVAAVERGLTRYARYPGSAGSGPPSIAIAPTRSGNQSWNGRSTR